jgi:putative Ca2+/H+ antiporter (TMEM165/GDT1 family)
LAKITVFYLLLATYATILVCECLGDKSLYTITSLTMRFETLYVFCGFTIAFMIKMGIAVLVGQAITELPPNLLTITSTVTFFITAFVIWRRQNDDRETTAKHSRNFSRATLTAFAAILFSEWGDVGQIMAATLTVKYRLPLLVWLGATLALISKGLLALVIGRSLRNRIPVSVLRPVCASLCAIMGIISAVEAIVRR